MSKRSKKLKQTAKWGGQDYDNPLLVWVGVVFFILVSLRVYLMQGGQIGHNWDASLPYVKELFVRIPVLSIYTWSEMNLGGTRELTISHLVANYLVAGLGYVFGAVWAVKVLILGVVLMGIWGFGRLVRYLVRGRIDSSGFTSEESPLLVKSKGVTPPRWHDRLWWMPFSILYGMSPFLFNEITGGSWYMWISYAFIPIWVMGLLRLTREGLRTRWLLAWLGSSIFVISSLQNFVLMEGVLFLFLLAEAISARKFRIYALRYVVAHLVLAVVNFYWILPLMLSLGGITEAVNMTTSSADGFLQVKNTSQNLLRIFDLSGYLNRDMYFWAVPGWFRWGLVLAGGVGMGLVGYGMKESSKFPGTTKEFGAGKVQSSKLRSQRLEASYYIWLAIFLIVILVVKGGNHPFGQVTMELFYNFPLMALYRSPQHLMLAPAFLVPLLLAYAYKSVRLGVKNEKLKMLDVGIWLLVLIWTSGWWWNGDIGHKTLLEQKRDHVDFFRLGKGLVMTYELNLKSEIDHRIMFLPTSFSPVYVQTAWQNFGQGGQPEYMYLPNPTFSEEATQIGKLMNGNFCGLDEFDWVNLASLISIRYVSLRGDILPLFSACMNRWDINHVYEILENDERVQKVIDGRYTKTYQVEDEYFLPKIYSASAKQSIVTDGTEDIWSKLAETVSREDYKIGTVVYFEGENTGVKELEKLEGRPMLEYKKISPVKYRVAVIEAKEPFELIFSENFNENWKVYLSDYDEYVSDEANKDKGKEFYGTRYRNEFPSGSISETWFRKPVFENAHKLVNGYANNWLINPEQICSELDNECFQHSDGSYDFELVIEFWNQRIFYLGLLISGIGWLGVFLFVFMNSELRVQERSH